MTCTEYMPYICRVITLSACKHITNVINRQIYMENLIVTKKIFKTPVIPVLKQLEIGQSAVYSAKERDVSQYRTAASQLKRRFGTRFTVRKMGDKVVITRTI